MADAQIPLSGNVGRPGNVFPGSHRALDAQSEEIKYRVGNSKVYSVVKMPGLIKYSNVTMKKGIFKDDNKFYDWFSQVKQNTIKRTDITISLLDETDTPTMVWTLKNAWPTKISGYELKAEGNEVAVESIEIVHEGMTITNGKA
jgi:conserved hypothetical phage tail region protein